MYCPKCGAPNQDAAAMCVSCGASIQPVRPRPMPIEDDPGMRILLPLGRSPWAIAAGYAGLLGIFPLFAPLALVLGIVAVRHLKNNPKLYGRGRAWFGVIVGALGSLLLAFFIVAAIAAPP